MRGLQQQGVKATVRPSCCLGCWSTTSCRSALPLHLGHDAANQLWSFRCDLAILTSASQGIDLQTIAVVHPENFTSILCAPSWVRSLQSAEPYSVFHALRLMRARRFSCACIITDNSAAYFTLVSGRIHASPPDRLRIFRRITRVCIHSHFQLQVALIPSKENLADPFTRPGSDTSLNSPSTFYNFRQASTVLTRFWWTSSISLLSPALGNCGVEG